MSIQQGGPAHAFYVLIQGEVKLAQVTSEGHLVLVRFIGPGEGFGIIVALSDAAHPLSAQVKEMKGRKVVVVVTLSAQGELCARGEVVAIQIPQALIPE